MLDAPCGIAVDHRGRLWVSDTGGRRVVSMTPDGELHAIIGASRLHEPTGLWVTETAVYIADPVAHAVARVSLDGTTASTRWEVDGAVVDVAVDEELGLLYCADRHGRVSVRPTAPELAATRTIDAIKAPIAVTLAPDRRRLYVADAAESALWAVDLRDSSASERLLTLPSVGALTLTPAGIAVAGRQSGELLGVNLRERTHTVIHSFDRSAHLTGVAFERHTRSYVVVDRANAQILRISRDGSSCEEIVPRPRAF